MVASLLMGTVEYWFVLKRGPGARLLQTAEVIHNLLIFKPCAYCDKEHMISLLVP